MNVPSLDLFSQVKPLRPSIFSRLERLFESGIFILGPEVQAFEEEIAGYLKVPHAIGVSSGTDALWLSLKALGIGTGHKVLTSPFTFFATVSAIVNAGATPVFADIDPDTYNLNPESVRSVLKNQKVSAIIAVHLYGQPADMDEHLALGEQYGIPVVEDACQAIGAEIQGRKVGGIGRVGCFSFYPTKNLGALGDGGLVTTRDSELAGSIRRLRCHGSSAMYRAKYLHKEIGSNCRLDAFQAAILRVFLPYLNTWIEKRQALARYYDEKFAELSQWIGAPKCAPLRNHTYHQYTVRVKKGDRDKLQAYLSERGVDSTVYYPVPCHLQKALETLGYRKGIFPIAEQAASEVLSLPIYPALPQKQQDYVVSCLRTWVQQAR